MECCAGSMKRPAQSPCLRSKAFPARSEAERASSGSTSHPTCRVTGTSLSGPSREIWIPVSQAVASCSSRHIRPWPMQRRWLTIFPTVKISNSKAKRVWRDRVCNRLARVKWVDENRIDLGEPDTPRANEDDFDAFVTAAPVLRSIRERIAITCPAWTDAKAEGSTLLTGVFDPNPKIDRSDRSDRTVAGSKTKPRPRRMTVWRIGPDSGLQRSAQQIAGRLGCTFPLGEAPSRMVGGGRGS